MDKIDKKIKALIKQDFLEDPMLEWEEIENKILTKKKSLFTNFFLLPMGFAIVLFLVFFINNIQKNITVDKDEILAKFIYESIEAVENDLYVETDESDSIYQI